MSNLDRLPLPYLNIPFNSTFQASLKEYEGCYIGTKSLLKRPGSRCTNSILATSQGLLRIQLPSTLCQRHEQLWVIPSGTTLAPAEEEYHGPALSLGFALQQSGSFVSAARRLQSKVKCGWFLLRLLRAQLLGLSTAVSSVSSCESHVSPYDGDKNEGRQPPSSRVNPNPHHTGKLCLPHLDL